MAMIQHDGEKKALKALVTRIYHKNPFVAFAMKHDGCDFCYEFFFDKRPHSLAEAYAVTDARVAMFMFFKACPPNADVFLNFSKRLVAFLIEQGEHSVAGHLAGRIGEAETLAATAVSWNESLIEEMTIADRREAHYKTLQRLGVSITRRLAYYVMDIVHQTLAGKFDERLSYYLAEFFRESVEATTGTPNPFEA